jgi:flagellar motor switch protein FliN
MTPMENLLENPRLNTVLDVRVQLTVRLGSCQLSMRDVLELSPGAIIQLNQRANDPVGLYVNDKLIALGEVVVVDENFGIKVTKLVGEPA